MLKTGATKFNNILCIDICRGGCASYYISDVVTIMREVGNVTEVVRIRLNKLFVLRVRVNYTIIIRKP